MESETNNDSRETVFDIFNLRSVWQLNFNIKTNKHKNTKHTHFRFKILKKERPKEWKKESNKTIMYWCICMFDLVGGHWRNKKKKISPVGLVRPPDPPTALMFVCIFLRLTRALASPLMAVNVVADQLRIHPETLDQTVAVVVSPAAPETLHTHTPFYIYIYW